MAPHFDVYDHLDYRQALRAFYAHSKARDPSFSFRAFTRKAGLKAPNHLKLVMDGDKNLSDKTAAQFARGMDLRGDRAEYFVLLVRFNQTSSPADRRNAYERLTGYRGYRHAQRLDMAQAAYHSHWYVPAIRELAQRADFRGEPAWIARQLRPRISVAQAARALEVLCELGMLERTRSGKLRPAGGVVVATDTQTRSVHVANYHRTMIALGADSIDTFSACEREISSLTFAIDADGFERLRSKLRRFHQELIAFAATQSTDGPVVQINFQLFPVTDTVDEEEGEDPCE